MTEVWADINGYENRYQISNHGRVKSVYREVIYSNGRKHKHGGMVLKLMTHPVGYYFLNLRKNGKRTNYFIHRLVAEAFISNPKNKPQINHIDGNKLNNRVDNLEWCTSSENGLHAYKIGLSRKPSGEEHSQSSLTNDQARKIRKSYSKGGITQRELGEIYNVDQTTIHYLVRKKSYKNV